MSRLEQKTGIILERIAKMKQWQIYSCVGTYLDIKQGADYIVNGIRIDITNMQKDLDRLGACHLGRFKIGSAHLKTSNGRFKLEEPVLMLTFYTQNEDEIADFFYGEDFEDVQDCFWDKWDELVEQGLIEETI